MRHFQSATFAPSETSGATFDAPTAQKPSSATILIADPDAAQRTLIDMLLSQDDYRIISVEDGPQALEALRRHTPDLAILDLDLPSIDGASICQKIKLVPRLSQVPVILTASLDSPSGTGLAERTRELVRFVRAELLLSKPLGDKDLRARVRRLITRKAQPTGSGPETSSGEVRQDGLYPADAYDVEIDVGSVLLLEEPEAATSEPQPTTDLGSGRSEHLEARNSELESALAEQERLVAALQARLDALVGTEARSKILLEDRDVKLANMKRENERLNERIEYLIKMRSDLETALSEQEALGQALQARLDGTTTELEMLTIRLTEIEEHAGDRIDGESIGDADLGALVESQAREIEALKKRNRLLIEAIEKEKRCNATARKGHLTAAGTPMPAHHAFG